MSNTTLPAHRKPADTRSVSAVGLAWVGVGVMLILAVATYQYWVPVAMPNTFGSINEAPATTSTPIVVTPPSESWTGGNMVATDTSYHAPLIITDLNGDVIKVHGDSITIFKDNKLTFAEFALLPVWAQKFVHRFDNTGNRRSHTGAQALEILRRVR